jgi:extracellular elastinolytic metalloproteinase
VSRRNGIRGVRGALLVATATLAAAAPAHAVQVGATDYQHASGAVAAVPASIVAARRSERAKLGRFGLLQVASGSGGVRAFGRLDALLTAASARPVTDIALDYVRARPQIFGLDASDLSNLAVVRHYSAAGIEQVRWAQRYDAITSIDTSLTANFTPDGRLIDIVGEPRHDLRVDSITPEVSASDAYATAARALDGPAHGVQRTSGGAQRATTFDGGGDAKLVIYESGSPHLGWRLTVPVDRLHDYDVVVDATTGVLQRSHNLVHESTASIYPNYPGAPVGGTAVTKNIDAYLDPSATTLSGPDAHTFTDAGDVVRNPGDVPPPAGEVGPSGGGNWTYPLTNVLGCVGLPCVWDPATPNSWNVNRMADATQVHWFVSNYHDYLENTPEIGFTTAAGNFEGSDPVVAQNMDGANTNSGLPNSDHINNANMSTFPDGTSPLMQMYLTNAHGHPASTGMDASVIYHEYTHGLVGRTITDASGAEAVGGAQGGAFNEGTADFYSSDYLHSADSGDLETDVAGTPDVILARFTFGALRSKPTDCPVGSADPLCNGGPHPGGYTYADFGHVAGSPEVHADGEIWTQTMWQLRTALIAKHGVTNGIAQTRRLLTNAMRLVPPNPSYLDMRNGLLEAALASPFTNDADDIWAVFANRGMGYFASTTSASDVDPIADTHLPPNPADPTGTVSGTVTDAATGAGVANVKVAFTGHDTGLGPELSATTDASGAYSITSVPPATYPLLRARGGGYAGQTASVPVMASTVTTSSFSLGRDLASAAAGAQIASFDGEDATDSGCGANGLIDQDPSLVWGTTTAADPDFPGVKSIVVKLASATDLTSITLNPTEGCGDPADASLAQYEVQASTDDTAFSSISSGTFTAADRGHDNAIALTSPPSGTRYIKLIAKTSQGNADFIDVAELQAFGTPATVTPPPPPPPPAVVVAPVAPAPPLPPPAPSPIAPKDSKPPSTKLSGSTSQKLGPTVSTAITCTDEGCSIKASASVRVPAYRGHKARTIKLRSVTTSLAKGKPRSLKLAISTLNRHVFLRALKAHKHLSAKIAIVVKDGFGNAKTVTRTVKLKR